MRQKKTQERERGNLLLLEKKALASSSKRGKPILTRNNTTKRANYSTNTSQIKSKKEETRRKKMNDAAAATFDAVSDGVSDVKDTVGKYVQFNANKTNFFIKLRKNLDVRFPGNSFHCCFVYICFRCCCSLLKLFVVCTCCARTIDHR